MTLPLQDPAALGRGAGPAVPPQRLLSAPSCGKREGGRRRPGDHRFSFVVLSIVAPYIAPYSVTEPSCAVYAPAPPLQHWLGCDDGGIDMLSLLMVGRAGSP